LKRSKDGVFLYALHSYCRPEPDEGGETGMKSCPKCSELNGDAREDCWRCHTSLKENAQENKRKICPKCGIAYMTGKVICSECGTYLIFHDGAPRMTPADAHMKDSDRAGFLLTGLAVLIPLLGFIIGYIRISDGKTESGKTLILAGIISCVLSLVFSIILAGCT